MEEIKLGATIIVVSKDLKALIVQRPKGKAFEGLWAVPGGKMENRDGVTVSEGFRYFPLEYTVIRELCEETGIVVYREDLRYLCSIIVEKELHRLLLSFYVFHRLNADEIPVKISESKDYRWISKTDIQNYEFIPDVGGEILDVLTRAENFLSVNQK